MKRKTGVRKIHANVMKQTEQGLLRLAKESGLSVGEIIDRVTLNMRPSDPELAVQLLEEEIIICLSGLSDEDYKIAVTDLIVDLVSVVAHDEQIIDKLIECKKACVDAAKRMKENLSEEEWKTLKDDIIKRIEEQKQKYIQFLSNPQLGDAAADEQENPQA